MCGLCTGKNSGNTVSNLSSTRALRDVTEAAGGKYFASAVGEVNVVTKMKEKEAVIGGEGNGGIIDPQLHYGRDALVGIALFLSLLAERKCAVSVLKASYPQYFMSKGKIALTPSIDVDAVLAEIEKRYKNEQPLTIDGVKIGLPRVGCICENPTQNPSFGYIPKQIARLKPMNSASDSLTNYYLLLVNRHAIAVLKAVV